MSSRTSMGGLALLLAGLLALISCSKGGTGCIASGTVTVNDQPLTEGLIMFMPQGGGRTVSAVITDGAFSIPASHELMPGSYKVAITAEKGTGKRISANEGSDEMVEERRQYIPEQYNAQSTLVAEISGDVSDLLFKLQI